MCRPLVPSLGLCLAAIGIGSNAGAAEPREVAVLSFSKASDPSTEGAWLPARLADMVASDLSMLGVDVRDRRFPGDPPESDARGSGSDSFGVLTGRVDPEAPGDPDVAVAVEIELRTPTGRTLRKKLSGRARDLERTACEIAFFVASSIGLRTRDDVRSLLCVPEYPYDVHRFLGLARSYFDMREWRRSMIMYERAWDLPKVGAIPEAISGHSLAEGELVGRGQAAFGARADLAGPAAEQVEVAMRDQNEKAATRALSAFLRYTSERALRWSIEASLDEKSVVLAHGNTWLLQRGPLGRRWSIDPRTGTLLAQRAPLKGPAGIMGEDPLLLDGKNLSRVDPSGQPRWRIELPFVPVAAIPGGPVVLTSGLAGILGKDKVTWVELSFGEIGQIAERVTALAAGVAGVVVSLEGDPREKAAETTEIAFLRPGKKSPAWTLETEPAFAVTMTLDLVLIGSKSGLTLIRAHDGKETARALPFPSGAKLIEAHGRYALVASNSGEVIVLDILAGTVASAVKGPSIPIAGYSSDTGVSVLYASGDLIHFHANGAVLDRALVPGRPLGIVRGNALAPGPVVITTRGLFAYAEVPPEPSRMRDVDAMLRLARIHESAGEIAPALRLATDLAKRSSGRILEAEQLRAELLERRGTSGSVEAARWARTRAEEAKDPTKRLSPFSLLPTERPTGAPTAR